MFLEGTVEQELKEALVDNARRHVLLGHFILLGCILYRSHFLNNLPEWLSLLLQFPRRAVETGLHFFLTKISAIEQLKLLRTWKLFSGK